MNNLDETIQDAKVIKVYKSWVGCEKPNARLTKTTCDIFFCRLIEWMLQRSPAVAGAEVGSLNNIRQTEYMPGQSNRL